MRNKKTKPAGEEEILDFLADHSTHVYSARELAKKLRVKRRDFKILRRTLRNLAHQKRLLEIEEGIFQDRRAGSAGRRAKIGHRRGKVVPPGAPRSTPNAQRVVKGVVQQYRGGFAFVVPEKGEQDIFVPPGATGGALHGDRVKVRIVKPQGQRKAEGQIVEVLERKTKNIVGTFVTGPAYGRIVPWDKKLQIEPIVSTQNFAGATDGMTVEAELISDSVPPEARIVALLGFTGEPDLDAKIVISKFGLPRQFSTEVLEEAELAASMTEKDYEGRKDFRDWQTVTIDGEKARDFDDAISVTAFKNGSFLLGVHIADVSYFVQENSILDREALERGNSVYFPDLVIPMLPEKLSNEICSLNPQVDRFTVSAVMKIDSEGKIVEYHLYPSVIRSNQRMTYTAVKRIVEDHDPELLRQYEPLVDMFLTMKKLALLLMEQRRHRGSIDFDLPEPEIILDMTTGRMTGIIQSERHIAHRIIEEFMLAANEVVAAHMAKSKLPGIYRIHDPPPPEKIMDFAAVAGSLGYRLPSDPEKIQPKDLAHLLERLENKPEERFLNVLLLRSMARARYALENAGHFGLALKNYTHFTSPIRRYPDLLVHRILKAMIAGNKGALLRVQRMAGRIPEIAEHCSITERRADEAEREFVQLKKVEFMHDKLGDVFDGHITGVVSYGLFVELSDFFVEGLIPLKYMDDDHYIFHEKRHFFKGRRTGKVYRLGDAVQVQVIRVDRDRREIDFLLV